MTVLMDITVNLPCKKSFSMHFTPENQQQMYFMDKRMVDILFTLFLCPKFHVSLCNVFGLMAPAKLKFVEYVGG